MAAQEHSSYFSVSGELTENAETLGKTPIGDRRRAELKIPWLLRPGINASFGTRRQREPDRVPVRNPRSGETRTGTRLLCPRLCPTLSRYQPNPVQRQPS